MKNWLLNKILIRMLNKLPPNVLKTLEWGSELVNNAIDSINRRKKNTPKKHFKTPTQAAGPALSTEGGETSSSNTKYSEKGDQSGNLF